MHELERLKDMLCKELYEIAEKGELTAGALETVHKLTDTIKNIGKIEMLEEGGYSEDDGTSYFGGNSYRGGNSYGIRDGYSERRGMHYVRGHYSRDGGRGGYSRAEGKDMMLHHLREMMDTTETEKEREAIRRCIAQLENA